jgi:hypothetical protein
VDTEDTLMNLKDLIVPPETPKDAGWKQLLVGWLRVLAARLVR